MQASSTKTKEWTFCDIFMTSPQVMRQSGKAVNCPRFWAQRIRIDEGMYLRKTGLHAARGMRHSAARPLATTGARRS
jgi:hypothetical protein